MRKTSESGIKVMAVRHTRVLSGLYKYQNLLMIKFVYHMNIPGRNIL